MFQTGFPVHHQKHKTATYSVRYWSDTVKCSFELLVMDEKTRLKHVKPLNRNKSTVKRSMLLAVLCEYTAALFTVWFQFHSFKHYFSLENFINIYINCRFRLPRFNPRAVRVEFVVNKVQW